MCQTAFALCNYTADDVNGTTVKNPLVGGANSFSEEAQFPAKSFQRPYTFNKTTLFL